MKTTLDLPDSLVKQVKLRALRDGRKLKDAVADLLRKGLDVAMDTSPQAKAPVVTTDEKTGLPLIECNAAATPQEELTPDHVADQLLAFQDEVGKFGTLLYAGKDWKDPELGRQSMILMAEKVMPQVNAGNSNRSNAAE